MKDTKEGGHGVMVHLQRLQIGERPLMNLIMSVEKRIVLIHVRMRMESGMMLPVITLLDISVSSRKVNGIIFVSILKLLTSQLSHNFTEYKTKVDWYPPPPRR